MEVMTTSRWQKRFRALAPAALALVRWEGAVLLAAIGFGAVSAFATRWFVAFVLLAAAFLYIAWSRALGAGDESRQFRDRARLLGIWVWGLLLLLIGLSIFFRFSLWWTAALFGLAYLAVGGWHLFWLARRKAESALQFRQIVALSILPILLAWVINSSVYQVLSLVLDTGIDESTATEFSANRTQRVERLAASDNPLAVTLSGGGYRAAAIHAGILSVFEQADLPVQYLSTVSGGSIVGGAYAMGQTATGFRDQLSDSKPGLPNDLINFYSAFAQLLLPDYGTGDTYARHFDRVYFDGATLNDTGPPFLIVNATRYLDGTRRAFNSVTDPDVSLARAVAASGAFPVAFDPVRIEGESYIDGGVVENLGIAGLQQFVESAGGRRDFNVPSVLIISDAGLIPAAPFNWNKPSVVQMAARAQQTSYFSMHQWIYSFYTDGAYDRAGAVDQAQPFEVSARRLWPGLPAGHDRTVSVFVFSAGSPSERQRYSGSEELLDAVAALDTLKELKANEVQAAFWVGARLAESYLAEVCAALEHQCSPVAIGPAPEL